MSNLENLKASLGNDYCFFEKFEKSELEEIMSERYLAYADETAFVLEAGCCDLEIALYDNGKTLYPVYSVSIKSAELDGEWTHYDTLPDTVNLNATDMEQEMFRVLDQFVAKNNLSYTELNHEKPAEISNNFSQTM